MQNNFVSVVKCERKHFPFGLCTSSLYHFGYADIYFQVFVCIYVSSAQAFEQSHALSSHFSITCIHKSSEL